MKERVRLQEPTWPRAEILAQLLTNHVNLGVILPFWAPVSSSKANENNLSAQTYRENEITDLKRLAQDRESIKSNPMEREGERKTKINMQNSANSISWHLDESSVTKWGTTDPKGDSFKDQQFKTAHMQSRLYLPNAEKDQMLECQRKIPLLHTRLVTQQPECQVASVVSESFQPHGL